jgi:hypothetical protein
MNILEQTFLKGYAIVPNFLSHKNVLKCVSAIEKLLESNSDNVIRCNETSYSYSDILNSNKTFILTREGTEGFNYDKGMIDIFNPNYAIHFLDAKFLGLSNFFNELKLKGYNFSNFNIYINSGVTCTRPTHFDGPNQIKIFIYLTDVPSINFGPYSYVPYSNMLLPLLNFITFFRRLFLKNQFYVKNFSFLDKFLHYILGTKGDLIISNQAGLHRGVPQSPSSTRILLVANFLKK